MTQKAIARHDYKKGAGLLRAGFQYQDLVAIEVLINFYRDRALYKWVQLEAEDSEFQSIEDVVACRPNGLYELTQVKFTADPGASANRLSWKWLTKVDDRNKRSLLQKWAVTTLRHKAAGTLAWAALKTDRVPDAEFRGCLKGRKVDYSTLSEDVKAKIEEQLGSLEEAKSFFQSFEFVHSKPQLDDFEDQLWQRVSSDTDQGGWYKFRWQVQRWSTRRKETGLESKVRHSDLRQVFSVEPSRPLLQDFRVPPTYSVPDKEFDRTFFEEITCSDGLTVLWGPPGRGKSTYLSHCLARIDRKNTVCIRHHYFLSLTDRSEGRFNYHAIARSLEHQLEKAIPDLNRPRENLAELLQKAARRLQDEDRRLIVIVDGLDHVWRENRDREEMEALFNALLPLPPNVRLIVGTQKIASEHLPARLLSKLPPERWTELPLMSQAAVHRWLQFHDKNERLNLKVTGWQTRDHIFRAVVQAFHDISSGLPLHLIYSFEAITRTGDALTADDVAALPACPTGDIRDYYRSFWERVGVKAQTILHVLAGLEFGPPPSAMHHCFGCSDESYESFAAIDHLLDYHDTEVRPFHGSLFAFVKDLPGHRNIFHSHASDVIDWLETGALEYWRWAWLWITKAQLGDSSDLLAKPSREWAISSLVKGYPIEQITAILDRAEKVAFDVFDLPRLLSLRSLKKRTIYGPTNQTDEWPLFREVGVALSGDSSVGAILRAELHRAPAGLIPFIVSNSEESLREQLAQAAIDELDRRIARHDTETEGYERPLGLVHAIVAVFANVAPENAQNVVEYAKQVAAPETLPFIYGQVPVLDSGRDEIITYAKHNEDADALIAIYARESLKAFNFENVFEAGERWTGPQLDRDVLAALCLEGLDPSAKPKLKALTHPAIRCLSLLKGNSAKRARTPKDLSHLFVGGDGPDAKFAHDTRFVLYEVFFTALAEALLGGKGQGWSMIPTEARATWLSEAVRALEQLAGDIAKQWLTSQQWPTLQEIYGAFELRVLVSRSYDFRRRFTAVRLALRDVAIDLCIIARGLDANSFVDARDIESVQESSFWLDGIWLEAFNERRLPLHTLTAAQALIERAGGHLDSNISEFNERATTAIKLAVFASDNGLVSLAKKELRRAIGSLLGYGWHKDMFALEVLKSLELLTKNGDEKSRRTLLELSGEFDSITIYTDGDETNYIRESYYRAIAKNFPERISACYAYLIHNEEWRYAEAITTAIIETKHVASRTGIAMLESYISPKEIRALEKADSVSRSYIDAALTVVRRKVGKAIRGTPEYEETQDTEYLDSNVNDSSPEEAEASVPDPCEFPPGRLTGYINEVRQVRHYDDRRELVTSWLRYWTTSGCADEALIDLEAAVAETTQYRDLDVGFGRAFDEAFKIALETQGRSKAFPWLIHAHISRFGWRWYHSDEEAQARMQAVAQHFRGQWKEFIKATAKPVFPDDATRNGIYIGQSRLVHFLIEVDEMDLARDYALEMARIFREELKEQPIATPEWSI